MVSWAAAGPGHDDRLRRQRAVGRRGPAARLHARLPQGPGPDHPRRSLVAPGPRHRAPDRARGGPAPARAHGHHHRAPAGDGPARRYDHDPGRWPHRRIRPARRAGPRSRLSFLAVVAHRRRGGTRMKTWRFFWRLMLFRPWPFWINCTCITLVFLVEIVPGFVSLAFFNRLSAHGLAALGLWWLIPLPTMAAFCR